MTFATFEMIDYFERVFSFSLPDRATLCFVSSRCLSTRLFVNLVLQYQSIFFAIQQYDYH